MFQTRLTKLLQIKHPIISAPMAFAAGGNLAAAVTNAGGLGLIGGAYGDSDWISEEFRKAGNARIGCGFITWNLKKAIQTNPQVLAEILDRHPVAIFLSFGDPAEFAAPIRESGALLICQVQTLRDAKRAIDSGANIVVAQGAEAGGHGESRSTMTIVPEVADYAAQHASNVIVCAAGGIADGRGLAAALSLGAEGVVVGSRFWASEEAEVHPNMLQAAITATGDDTIRSSVMDIARHLNWPERYTARVLKNAFTDRWHNDIEGLLVHAQEQAELWRTAWQRGNTNTANTFVGEATGLIDSVEPAQSIIDSMVREAKQTLENLV